MKTPQNKTGIEPEPRSGSLDAVVRPPNKYDQAFFRWFKDRGWRILHGLGEIAVWSNDDICCPFKVTEGMIQRLEAAGMIKQWIPDHCGIWDRWYVTNDRWPNASS